MGNGRGSHPTEGTSWQPGCERAGNLRGSCPRRAVPRLPRAGQQLQLELSNHDITGAALRPGGRATPSPRSAHTARTHAAQLGAPAHAAASGRVRARRDPGSGVVRPAVRGPAPRGRHALTACGASTAQATRWGAPPSTAPDTDVPRKPASAEAPGGAGGASGERARGRSRARDGTCATHEEAAPHGHSCQGAGLGRGSATCPESAGHWPPQRAEGAAAHRRARTDTHTP